MVAIQSSSASVYSSGYKVTCNLPGETLKYVIWALPLQPENGEECLFNLAKKVLV